MKAIGIFFIGVILFLVGGTLVTGCVAWNARATIVSEEQAYQARWADVQSQYQRRSDLLGNMASAVKGYVKEEDGVWKAFAAARSQGDALAKDPELATNPEKQSAFLKAQENITVKINAVREAYPQLQSQPLFVRYMDELAGTENRVNVARERYTQAIESYNSTVGMWGSFFGYKQAQFYKADDAAQKAPTINF